MRGLPDYAEAYRWKLQFLQLPSVGIAGFPLSQALDLRCESATLPKMSNEEITVENRGHQVNIPGRSIYSKEITLTLQETTDAAIQLFLKGWRELIWGTRSGKGAKKEDCEAVIRLELLDKEDKPYWQYVAYGVWLKDYTLPDLTSSNEIIKIPAVFSFDFFTDSRL